MDLDFLLSLEQTEWFATFRTTLLSSLRASELSNHPCLVDSPAFPNIANTSDESHLLPLGPTSGFEDEVHPLVLTLLHIFQCQLASLILVLRCALAFLVRGAARIWDFAIDKLLLSESVAIFDFCAWHGLLLLPALVFCIGTFWFSRSGRQFACRGNASWTLDRVSSTVSLLWTVISALVRGYITGSTSTQRVPGLPASITQLLKYPPARTASNGSSTSRSFTWISPDSYRISNLYRRRRVLSETTEEPAQPSIVSPDMDPTKRLLLTMALRRSVRLDFSTPLTYAEADVPAASLPEMVTLQSASPAAPQATLMGQISGYIDVDSSEESRSRVARASEAWDVREDFGHSSLAALHDEASDDSMGSGRISYTGATVNESRPTSVAPWSYQYHLRLALRNGNCDAHIVLDLTANSSSLGYVSDIGKTRRRAGFIDMAEASESMDVGQHVDRHRRVLTEPHFPSNPSILGIVGVQPLPSFQSLGSMVRYLELCLHQPDFGRTLSTQHSTEAHERAMAGNVLVLASRAELRKTKSTGDVRKRWFGPKAFLVLSKPQQPQP